MERHGPDLDRLEVALPIAAELKGIQGCEFAHDRQILWNINILRNACVVMEQRCDAALAGLHLMRMVAAVAEPESERRALRQNECIRSGGIPIWTNHDLMSVAQLRDLPEIAALNEREVDWEDHDLSSIEAMQSAAAIRKRTVQSLLFSSYRARSKFRCERKAIRGITDDYGSLQSREFGSDRDHPAEEKLIQAKPLGVAQSRLEPPLPALQGFHRQQQPRPIMHALLPTLALPVEGLRQPAFPDQLRFSSPSR